MTSNDMTWLVSHSGDNGLLLRCSNDLFHQAELKNGYLVRQDITKHDKT